jgi:hypothetical protein
MAYPHFVHGYTKAGYPVVYEKPGEMKLKELLRKQKQIGKQIKKEKKKLKAEITLKH